MILAWRPSWLEVGITGHIFGRGPSKDHSTKLWLQCRPVSKIAAITKNRNFFKWLKLLYFKPESAQI
jgi:hypothetical protein